MGILIQTRCGSSPGPRHWAKQGCWCFFIYFSSGDVTLSCTVTCMTLAHHILKHYVFQDPLLRVQIGRYSTVVKCVMVMVLFTNNLTSGSPDLFPLDLSISSFKRIVLGSHLEVFRVYPLALCSGINPEGVQGIIWDIRIKCRSPMQGKHPTRCTLVLGHRLAHLFTFFLHCNLCGNSLLHSWR